MAEELADNVINTKVTDSSLKRLKAICVKNNFSLFDMLQMMLDCLIRFMDDRHNLDPNLIRIIRMFEGLPGWKNALRLTEPLEKEVKKEVTKGGVTKIVTEVQSAQIMEAFYVLRHPNGKGAPRVIHVTRPMLDGDPENWSVTYNIDEQFDQFVKVINPSLHRHLHAVMSKLGTESMTDALHQIADDVIDNPDVVDLRTQFENNDWHKGAKLYDRVIYKRPYTHGMDYIEKQQTLFDKEEEE